MSRAKRNFTNMRSSSADEADSPFIPHRELSLEQAIGISSPPDGKFRVSQGEILRAPKSILRKKGPAIQQSAPAAWQEKSAPPREAAG